MAVTTTTAPPSSLFDAGALGWIRHRLFGSIPNATVTIVLLYLAWKIVPALLDWLIFNAVVTADGTRACRAAMGSKIGACWALITDKYRLILFGLYPYDEQWRPLIVVILLVALVGISCWRRFWNMSLLPIWLVGLAVGGILMWGGVFGLRYVSTERWGGLPLTLILSIVGMSFAFPLAILLALGRRSRMPAIKAICVIYIELIRGVPLISLLFMASVMFPLFLPDGVTIDKLLRAQVAIIMFAAAYQAEVIRGGLQSIPKGQYEAADALGLGYWQKTGFIILPQALRIVIPPMVNSLIAMFKDTSLVVIIGLYDLMNAAKASFVDPAWRGTSFEAYVFVAMIYFVFCFFMSKYSQNLEERLAKATKR
jgi:general L-amino acid transport system permease protein